MPDAPPALLLIDDEPNLLIGLSAVLQRAGYRVLTAANGNDGLRLAREHLPALIICDIMMPPPNGLEVRRLLAEDPRTADVPFIFLTARDALSDKINGLYAGADDYITKPFDRSELLARIQAVTRRDDRSRQAGRAELEAQMQRLRQEISQNFDHELRTPLAVVIGSLELALHKSFAGDARAVSTFIAQALSNAEHLHVLVEDLITLNQIDQGAQADLRQEISVDTDFRWPIERVLKRWESQQPRPRFHIAPGMVIYAPRAGFRQAVAHLVDNACKFSPAGGRVDMVLLPNGKGGCRFIVADEGPGIPPNLREKVFERYYQVSQGLARQFGGLGVGLTIARSFARSLGGDVRILDAERGCRVEMIIAPGELGWIPAHV